MTLAVDPARSVGEVVAQDLRALEVHVVQLGAGPLGRRRASAPGCTRARPPSMSSSWAQSSGTSPSPTRARRGRRERRVEVGGGGEEDADEVVVGRRSLRSNSSSSSACTRSCDLVGVVLVERGRAAQGSNGGEASARATASRRCRVAARPVRAPAPRPAVSARHSPGFSVRSAERADPRPHQPTHRDGRPPRTSAAPGGCAPRGS